MAHIRNYMEEAVEQYVNHWLIKEDVCQCEECRMDIMAIMLNNLSPQYVVTDTGALFKQLSEFDLQHRVDLMTAMTEAVAVVKKNPRHQG